MKRLLIGLAFIFTAANNVKAQDTTKTKYRYYPAENVYYNKSSGYYWYYDKPTSHWLSGKTLPNTYQLTSSSSYYNVYYKKPGDWNANTPQPK